MPARALLTAVLGPSPVGAVPEDPPEARPHEVDVRDDLQYHERDRPEHSAERRHHVHRQRVRHRYPDDSISEDRAAPDHRAYNPYMPELRYLLPEVIPGPRGRPDPATGRLIEDAPAFQQWPRDDEGRGTACEQAEVHVGGPRPGQQAVPGEQGPRAP